MPEGKASAKGYTDWVGCSNQGLTRPARVQISMTL